MRSALAAKQIWVAVITIWGTLDSLPRCPNIKIFHIYAGMQQILLNFVFMYKNFNFSYSWVLKNYMQKWSVFMQISWKNSDLNFLQKNVYFEWICNFVQNLFGIDMKMMQNFVQKKSFCAKSCNFAQENWLFRGNPNQEASIGHFMGLMAAFPPLPHTIYLQNWLDFNEHIFSSKL